MVREVLLVTIRGVSFLSIHKESVVRHVVQYFHADNETVLIDLVFLTCEEEVVKDRAVVNFNPILLPQLPMLLLHCLLAPLGQLRRYLHKNILAVPVQIQTVVFIEIKYRISQRPCARPNLNNSKVPNATILHLIGHKGSNCVAIIGLKQLGGCHPLVLGVETLHFVSKVMVSAQLIKLYWLFQSTHLMLGPAKVSARLVIQAIMDEVPQNHSLRTILAIDFLTIC